MLGLNNLNRLADEMKTFTEKSGASSVPSTRKGELSFRGVSEIADVLASDLSGPGESARGKSHLAEDTTDISMVFRRHATAAQEVTCTYSS